MNHLLLSTFLACIASASHADELPVGMARADVIFLGEIHDNPHHHARQAELTGALQPAAIVFEMLTPEQAALVTDEARQDIAALEAVLEWENTGWPDFAMYGPLFQVVPEARIYGAAVLREEASRVMAEGAAAVFGPDAGDYGLDQPLPEDQQQAREEAQFAAHCDAMPMEMMGMMVDFQRLRDASLARAINAAMADTGGPVVVITGNGHARMDHGAPHALAIAAPELQQFSLGQYELAAPEVATTQFDAWEVTEAVDRPDPCAAFQSN